MDPLAAKASKSKDVASRSPSPTNSPEAAFWSRSAIATPAYLFQKYIYIYIHREIYIYISIHIYIYMYTCIHVYMYICTYVYIYIHIHVFKHMDIPNPGSFVTHYVAIAELSRLGGARPRATSSRLWGFHRHFFVFEWLDDKQGYPPFQEAQMS